MPTTGWIDPWTSSTDNAVGTRAWTDVVEVVEEDGTAAQVTLLAGEVSEYLVPLFDLPLSGAAVPAEATITGIGFRTRRWCSGPFVRDEHLRAVKGGAVSATNLSASDVWPNGDPGAGVYETFGGDGELWGETWTPADVNGSTFGLAMSAENFDGASMDGANVDVVQVQIWYTLPSRPGFRGAVFRRPDEPTDPQFAE